MEKWFAFRAYNSQTIIAYGTESEADRYADHLNADREINVYGAYGLTAAEAAELNPADRCDTFNLSDALAEIE